MFLSSKKSIYYDDVNLLAQKCTVKSRKDISREMDRFISSPMSAIGGTTFIKEAVNLGLTVCVHRFQSIEKQLISAADVIDYPNLFFAVGLDDKERIDRLIKNGVKHFLIDIANGYLNLEIELVRRYICNKISNDRIDKKIMVGNVHTKEGFENLAVLVDDSEMLIRIGIGGGQHCKTASVTGYNRGQITEISDIKEYSQFFRFKPKIVADGGIKSSCEAVKAFGAGADYLLIGTLFSQACEAECHVTGDKRMYGGASLLQANLLGKEITHSEGRVSVLDFEPIPLKQIVDNLWAGISSGISYGGFSSLNDFIGNGTFELKYK